MSGASMSAVVIARQFGSALEPFILDLSGSFHGLFFALRFVSFCRPSSKRPRSRAARGSSLQRAPRTPPAKNGLMRATGEAPGGATDLKCGWLAKKRWSERPGVSARKQGSGDREDRADGRFAPRMNSESAALGSLAMRQAAHGTHAGIGGVAGNSPLEWGAGDLNSRVGKVLSPRSERPIVRL